MLMHKIDSFDLWSLYTIKIRWYDHVSNGKISEHTNQPPALCLTAQCRTCWTSHLVHCPSDYPTLVVYHFSPSNVGWKRPCGAPCTCWRDVVQSDLEHLQMDQEEIEEITRDQCRWHPTVKLVSSTSHWHEA